MKKLTQTISNRKQTINRLLKTFIWLIIVQFAFTSIKAQQPVDSTENFFYVTQIEDAYYDSLLDVRGADSMQGTGYKSYLRWKGFNQMRVDETGTLDSYISCVNGYYKQQAPKSLIDWNYYAPVGIPDVIHSGFGKGWVNQILIGSSKNHIFAGTHNNGIWETTNHGVDWYCITTKYPDINGIASMKFNSNNEVYALTFTNICTYSNGLYHGVFNSTTAAWDWNSININAIVDTDAEDIYPSDSKKRWPKKILVHPSDDDILYVLTKCYIFKSINAGNTWTTVCDMDNVFDLWPGDEGFEDIIFDPVNPNKMYVSGTIILKSTDGGNNWDIDITDAVTGFDKVTTCTMDARTFQLQSNVWFLYTYTDIIPEPDENKIVIKKLRSDIYYPIFEEKQFGRFSGGSGKINIKVHPSDEERLYFGGVQLYSISYNDALGEYEKFMITNPSDYNASNFLHDDTRDMMFYHVNGAWDLYIGCDGGVSRAHYEGVGSSGEEWTMTDLSIQGSNETDLNISEVYAISTSGNKGKIAFNCQDIGGYHFHSGVLKHLSVGDGGAVLFDNIYDNYIYYNDIQFPPMVVDMNNINSFILKGIPSNSDSYFFAPIVKNPGNPEELYIGIKGLYKYNDIYSVIANNHEEEAEEIFAYYDGSSPVSFIQPTDIEISHINPNIMYVSTKQSFWSWDATPPGDYHSALYKSTDGGTTWSDISTNQLGLYGAFITDIELNPDNDEELWLTFNNATTPSPTNPTWTRKVYRYYQEGSNWLSEPDDSGLPPGLPVFEMVIDEITGDSYLATDVGVWKRTQQNPTWENISFNENDGIYYQRMVTDIEINHAERRLYTSTFGGGIWYTDLSVCPEFNSTELEITAEETTWSKPQIMNSNVVVKSGANLIIKDVVYFHQNAKLIVERGARLEINGGKLTNSCDGDYWEGVEVWGDSEEPQNSGEQGWLYITNKGCIENAKTAILANRTSSSAELRGFTGGVIRANGGVFINNNIAINLENLDGESLSDIYNCTFITNDDWQNDDVPEAFIKLTEYSDYGQLEISGCKFINKAVENIIVKGIGEGIHSLNSSYTVDQVCTTTNYPCDEFKGCSFENLYYAIHSTGTEPISPLHTITNSEFINNRYGVYIDAINNAVVTSNSFNLNVGTDSRGLYLNECTAYHVEDNYFTSPNNATPNFGIIVNYSGPYVNEIYRNTFESINTGINAQDENRASDGSGLSLRCNLFNNTIYDVNVLPSDDPHGTYMGIANTQGAGTTNPEDMAGNNFYYNNADPDDDDDLYNELMFFDYYYPSHADLQFLRPYDFTNSTIEPKEKDFSLFPWEFEEGCPSKLDIGGGGILREQLTTTDQKIDSVTVIIESLVDGGNTEALESSVDNSVPPETMLIYNQLLDESPYLSDTVVSTSIEKEEVLPNAMIRDIMVANTHTAKSDILMEKLDERTNPMPGYMKSEILQGRDSVSLKEENEAVLLTYRLQKHTVFNELVRQYGSDTVNPGASSDSLISLLTIENNLHSEYQLAFTRLKRDEYQLGSELLSNIPNSFTLSDIEYSAHQSIVDYYNILSQAAQADSTAIWPDSTQLLQIWELYNTGSGIASTYARNLLIEYDNLAYIEPIAYPNLEKSATAEDAINHILNSDKPEFLKVMPNPAKDYIILAYKLEMPGDAEIILLDIKGNLMQTIKINKSQGQEIVNIDVWMPGLYIATLNTKVKKLQSIKFTVVN